MIKNIIIAILLILTFSFFVYGRYQQTEARKLMKLAYESGQQVIDIEKRTLEQMRACQMEAERQKQIAEGCARTKK